MGLSLAELRALPVPRFMSLPKDVQEEVEEDEFEEETSVYDHEDFMSAMSLLESSMRMLGFYGDQAVSKAILKKDRERMLALAEEIKQFEKMVRDAQEEELNKE